MVEHYACLPYRHLRQEPHRQPGVIYRWPVNNEQLKTGKQTDKHTRKDRVQQTDTESPTTGQTDRSLTDQWLKSGCTIKFINHHIDMQLLGTTWKSIGSSNLDYRKRRSYLVQPLKRPVKVNLDPARSRCDVLAVIFRAPALSRRK